MAPGRFRPWDHGTMGPGRFLGLFRQGLSLCRVYGHAVVLWQKNTNLGTFEPHITHFLMIFELWNWVDSNMFLESIFVASNTHDCWCFWCLNPIFLGEKPQNCPSVAVAPRYRYIAKSSQPVAAGKHKIQVSEMAECGAVPRKKKDGFVWGPYFILMVPSGNLT